MYETEKYEFNENDKLVLKVVSNFRNNKNTELTAYKYDERGNLIEEGTCVFYSNGTCEPRPLFGYEYNSKNQLSKKYQLAKFSPHNTDEYYSYDDKGNQIESKGMYVYTDKLPFWGYHYIYEYDEIGNKIKEEELIGKYRRLGQEEYQIKTNGYDQFNNMISEEYITDQGSTIKVVKQKYLYDKKGNWVRSVKEEGRDKSNLKVVEICTREISYYR